MCIDLGMWLTWKNWPYILAFFSTKVLVSVPIAPRWDRQTTIWRLRLVHIFYKKMSSITFNLPPTSGGNNQQWKYLCKLESALFWWKQWVFTQRHCCLMPQSASTEKSASFQSLFTSWFRCCAGVEISCTTIIEYVIWNNKSVKIFNNGKSWWCFAKLALWIHHITDYPETVSFAGNMMINQLTLMVLIRGGRLPRGAQALTRSATWEVWSIN